MDSSAQRFTGRAYSWLLTYGARAMLALAIFFAGQWVTRIMNRWFKKILSGKRFDITLRPFLQSRVPLNLFLHIYSDCCRQLTPIRTMETIGKLQGKFMFTR